MAVKSTNFPSYKKVPVADLIPYANNARTHSDNQVAQIAASIKEFGFINPVIVDGEKGIVAGHGRVMAAKKLGISEVPVVEVGWLTDAQRKAYILADNKLALNAGWDTELLKVELSGLEEIGFDVSLIGFDEAELADLMTEQTEGLTDPDDVPELEDDAVSKPGDVWVMGNHRLLCGDSTVAMDVEKLLGSVKPHLMVTDPPYGVNYEPEHRSKNVNKLGKVTNDDQADWSDAWVLFPGEVAYVWCAPGPLNVRVFQSLMATSFECRQQIVWAKDRMALGRGHYHYQYECLWYAVRKNGKGHWNGDRKQTSIWNIKAREDKGHGHSTQKPVECMKRPIENNSSPGQAVYEPFSGSGTTIIAAEMTGRHCYAIELEPAYVDMAVKRWQDFTGMDAILEGDGRSFNNVKEGAQADTTDAEAS